jgi:hypothetical protein
MKRSRWFVMLGVLSLALPAVVGAHEGMGKDEKAADETITGEIIDVACYGGHGAKGAAHADCGKKCLEGGGQAAVLTDKGDFYLALGKNHGSASQMLAPYAGKQAKVTGDVTHQGNANFIVVEKVDPAK